MESDYGVQLPRNLLIEFSQIVQQLSDSSGKEVTSPMLWETFRAEYLESRTRWPGLLNLYWNICKMYPIRRVRSRSRCWCK